MLDSGTNFGLGVGVVFTKPLIVVTFYCIFLGGGGLNCCFLGKKKSLDPLYYDHYLQGFNKKIPPFKDFEKFLQPSTGE